MKTKIANKNELAQYIDHTLLSPIATVKEIEKLCYEAIVNNFASVCILPSYVIHAKQFLAESLPKVCTVIGFPLGANVLPVKLFELEEAIDNGAQEVDIVVNNAFLKNSDFYRYEEEINLLNLMAKNMGAATKFIIETSNLTKEEKIFATKTVSISGADFVKTSTGFSSAGATVEDILLLKENCSEGTRVKASGGIRTLEFALDLIDAGANRIGTSSGLKILEEFEKLK